MEKVKLNTIEEAIEDFKAGNFVIVVDDEDRENEGDLIIAAEKITSEKSEFYAEACTWSIVCSDYGVSLQRAGFTSSGNGQYLGIGYSFYGDCR